MAKTTIEKFFGNRYVQLAALAAGAIGLWRTWHTKGTSGVGAADEEYVIKAYWNDGRYGNVRIFTGWDYDRSNGEKWAKWSNPLARWMEYDEKIYKTRKGAEKAIQDLIAAGEDRWNDYPVQLSAITWDEYVNNYIRR